MPVSKIIHTVVVRVERFSAIYSDHIKNYVQFFSKYLINSKTNKMTTTFYKV